MYTVTSGELASMGVSHDQSKKIMFKGRDFILGPSFSTANKDICINFCIQEEKKGYRCLLVESSNSITVWKHFKIVKDDSAHPKENEGESEKLVKLCRLELTKCIGPMAELIIDDLLAEASKVSRTQFIDMISDQIPDSKISLAFKKNMNY